MSLSPLLSDQTMLTVLAGTDRDLPVMIAKSGGRLSGRSMARADAVV